MLREELRPENWLKLSKELPPEVFINFVTSLLDYLSLRLRLMIL